MAGAESGVRVRVTRLPGSEGLALPEPASAGSSGSDVRAALPAASPLTLAPGERAAVPTGLRVEVPPGWELQIRPRSGLALRHGLTVANAPGTIDSDYRGEVRVILVNLGSEAVQIQRGERIAQLVLAPVARVHWQEVETLEDSGRGVAGFGSTGRS